MEGKKLSDPKKIFRIAKAMASDIQMYNKNKIEKAIKEDNFWEAIENEYQECKELLEQRVDPEILAKDNYLDRAIVDIILKYSSNIESKIW